MKTINNIKVIALAASIALASGCAKDNGPKSEADSELRAGNIVGGTVADASFQKANGVVGLIMLSEGGQGLCTGTLISKRIVLTAAHCLADSELTGVAVVFAPNVSSPTEDQIRFGVKIAVHQAYGLAGLSLSGSHNDIALLKLDSDAPADFQPARLPASDNLKAKTMLTQAGFGKTQALRNTPGDTSGTLKKVDGIQLIAKSKDGKELLMNEDGKGSCNGDSGGPAYAKAADGKLTQVGLNSRGTDGKTCIGVGIYTNVAAHLAWIRAQSVALMAAKDPVAPAPPKAN